MLKLYGIIVFVLYATGAALKPDKEKKDVLDIKVIEHSLAKITDSIYAGKYEVSNRLYRLFEQDLRANGRTDLLKITMVDSLNWRDKLAYNEPYVDYYYSHPAYKDYPVVNVSYEAAVLFCEWLTEKYNEFPKRKFKKVAFRLPSAREWTFAARCNKSSSPYPWGSYLMKDCKYMCNFKHYGDERITYRKDLKTYEIVKKPSGGNSFELFDATEITAPVHSYFPNDFGLYNVCGNVAEMINEKGRTRGGSYKNTGWDVRIDAADTFEKPATDVGFRYFMEILEK
ncbi:MAG TPA: SUMF1/EgtB/PvdO family nonheme iron enzyme [Bacteroidales bacterium]|nr:SUMF1/EgtB/PvdO family nonheme iron enzyme [Bacteroidales bacterium]